MYNLHYGNTYNFYFGQPSPQANTASISSGMPISNIDPSNDTSMSLDDAMSGRSSATSQIDDSDLQRMLAKTGKWCHPQLWTSCVQPLWPEAQVYTIAMPCVPDANSMY
eukprot:CAMPEP_0203763706 /NCGR_PEP_ID=MMETSP0098-20131031/16682_1 /ASSEMBLY_ACC=CAM_ASM_000208 /TAXON_ID=96639 /ORGANISM=" , Strain NY0313808BC1" /LENGTH=108 /DNA_ID=CAMNT_0050658811 /DNA_START=104 /DNA_END=429 /DNA_ORIENTATION=-